MAKTVLIIPGFTEYATTKGYRSIAAMFRKNECEVKIVKIDWQRKVMSDYVAQFLEIAKEHMNDETYILGFSFGAYIAFATAAEIKPKALFLCSLSPYFKEDLAKLPARWKKTMGKHRMADFPHFSASRIARDIVCPTYLLLGDTEAKEAPILEHRAVDVRKKIHNSNIIRIPGGRHEIAQREYQQALQDLIDRVMK